MARATGGSKFGPLWANSPRPKKEIFTIRAAAELTGSFVATDWMDVSAFESVQILFKYTKASLTRFECYLEQSDDETTWYYRTTESLGTTENNYYTHPWKYSGSENPEMLEPVAAQYARLQVRGIGMVGGSSLEIKMIGVS